MGGALTVVGTAAAASTSYAVTATIPVGINPFGVAVDPGTHTAYVANGSSSTVSVIDGATNTVTANIHVGGAPTGVAVDSSTHTVYVSNDGSNNVSVIDGATRVVTATIPVGQNPIAVAVDPATHTAYVTNQASNTVSVIDGATNTVVATIPVGITPSAVAVDPGTHTAYVANESTSTVSVIDGGTATVTATILVGNFPFAVAVDPGTHTIYVPSQLSNTVSVIDGASTTVTATVPVGSVPIGVAVDSSTHAVYVTNQSSNNVSVIDGAANTVTATIPVGIEPFGVAVDPGTHTAYVANFRSNTVSVITATSVAPSITTQPSDQTVTAGQTATFSAAASGTPTPTVQWQTSTDVGATFTDLPGETSTTLVVAGVTTAQSGNQYRATFTNATSSVTTTAATLTVTPLAQTITFTSTAPASPVVGDTYAVSAAATSGLIVEFTIDASSTPGTCSISGDVVSFTGSGTCVVDADQPGNSIYSAAPQASQALTIGPGPQGVVFTSTPPASPSVGGSYSLSAIGGASGNPVVFSIDASSTAGACTISGPTVSFTGSGTCVIDADQAGNADYEAGHAQQSLTIATGAQTVTFVANGGSGTMAAQSANAPTPLTPNTFTRAGFTFTGWNTSADGSGTAYADGASYPFTADTTLYAQWVADTHTVTFVSNGGSGTMAAQSANAPTALTPNTFTRAGFTFTGWNTSPDGSGTAYADGASYPFTADATLYAQWLINVRLSQTITFGALASRTLAQSPVLVSATASSGLTVTFTTTTPNVCVSSGPTGSSITLLSAGTCTVVASQPGDATYTAAPSVSRSFTVTKAAQTITFGEINGKTLAQSPLTVSATASSGLAVVFTTTTPSICVATGPTGATITLLTTGTCTVRASQPGNAIYNPAQSVSRSFTVSKASQKITFSALNGRTLLQSPVTVSATASSGLTVTFTTTTPAICVASGPTGATITLIATGTCTVQATQAGDATYNPAPAVSRSFTVSKAAQTITFAPLAARTLAQSPLTVSATASSGLTVIFSTTTPTVCTAGGQNGAAITLLTTGTCTVRANQPGDATYNAALAVSRNFTVSKAAQTITFAPLATATLAQSPLTMTAASSSGLTVTFTTTTPLVCTAGGADGATITLLARGTCTVRASQPGNATYNAATAVTRSFVVA